MVLTPKWAHSWFVEVTSLCATQLVRDWKLKGTKLSTRSIGDSLREKLTHKVESDLILGAVRKIG